MGEIDAAVQLVKLEIDGINYCFRIVGSAGIELIKAFAKLIKKMGTAAINSHKEKKLEEIKGEAEFKEFKKKYAGDDVTLIELKDADIDSFIDMCSKEGIAVTRLPDFDLDDGYSQFMVAGSTIQTIKFNFEKINRWHMEHDKMPEAEEKETDNTVRKSVEAVDKEYLCGREISAADYVHTAPGATTEEKEGNFKKAADELFPSNGKETAEVIDLSDGEKFKQFIKNAGDDQRLIAAEQGNYRCFDIEAHMIVGENDREISVMTSSGEQIEVDKNLVFLNHGKTQIYCAIGDKAELGEVRCRGEKINANVLENKMKRSKTKQLKTSNGVLQEVPEVSKKISEAALQKNLPKK